MPHPLHQHRQLKKAIQKSGSSATATSSSDTSSSSSGAAAGAETTSISSTSGGLSKGAATGIGAGVGISALIFAALGVGCYFKRHRAQKNKESQDEIALTPQVGVVGLVSQHDDSKMQGYYGHFAGATRSSSLSGENMIPKDMMEGDDKKSTRQVATPQPVTTSSYIAALAPPDAIPHTPVYELSSQTEQSPRYEMSGTPITQSAPPSELGSPAPIPIPTKYMDGRGPFVPPGADVSTPDTSSYAPIFTSVTVSVAGQAHASEPSVSINNLTRPMSPSELDDSSPRPSASNIARPVVSSLPSTRQSQDTWSSNNRFYGQYGA